MPLIEGFNPDFVLADKGYDSNDFIENIKAIGAVPVIPPRCNRDELRGYDHHLYKERNLVDRLFQKLKQFRRIATRHDRLAQNYLSMLHLASVLIWLN